MKQCSGCHLLFTSPRPSEVESIRYYQTPGYISHAAYAKGIFDLIYLIIRYFAIRSKFKLVSQYVTGSNLLDIGCGTGSFLKYSSKRFHAVGVEPSDNARSFCQRERLDVLPNLQSLSSRSFHIITLWHVLEHLHDLPATMTFLKTHLEDNGTIFIAVPNHESLDAQYYHQDWAAYDVPRHLWHFSKMTMTKLAAKHGFQIKAIYPMKLDAYYVSMLSEKYRRGKHTAAGILNAITVGLRSNFSARRNQNYSSLIYVLQK
ncbi:MAG: class I SAM-dependent methyltransferase [Bacteroidetes bacterium]|nr:class I SAM-dependent methyltransferase [Bacteroidota bacterium]